ncbi:DUF4403 family protein [Mucilaginibacter sp.]|jgi:hypothetical protein|uniref:DUF4403 family protein n=1 Tax=Mucilaginibacter sp. TaxID=1882438 RepID=UPI00356A9A0B
MKKSYLLLIVVVFMASCSYKIAKPTRSSNTAAYPKLDSSVIQASVYLAAHDVRREVFNQIHNPVAQGSSGKINIKLLATEQITAEEMVRSLLKPYEPGYWKDVMVEVSETVKESFKCWTTPWKWHKCWKNVIKKAWKATKVWIEPQVAVYGYVSQPITKFIDKVYPTSGEVKYNADITNIDIRFDDNVVKTTTYIKVHISVDYEQATVPLGPSIKLKGVLSCDVEAKIDVNGKLSINNNKQFNFDLIEGDTKLEFTKICIPGAVEALNIQAILNPKLFILKEVLSKQVHKIINEKLSEAIKKGSENLSFKEQYDQLTMTIQKPMAVSEKVWLVSNISETYVSPFTSVGSGADNKLLFNIGLTARPNLYYNTDTPLVITPKPIPFSVKPVINSQVNISVAGNLDYSVATPIVDSALNNVIKQIRVSTPIIQNYLTRKNFGVSNVQIYPSDKKLIVGIDIVKKKKNKKVLTIYLSALPAYDNVKNYFYLDQIGFTIETRNVLLKILKSAAEIDFVEKALNKEIARNTKFNVNSYYRDIIDTIKHFEIPLQLMNLTGNFDPVNVTEVFTTDSALVVYVTVRGKLSATFDPHQSLADNSDSQPLTDSIRVQNVVSNKLIATTPQLYTEFIPPLKSNLNDPLTSDAGADLSANSSTTKTLVSNKAIVMEAKEKRMTIDKTTSKAAQQKSTPNMSVVNIKLPQINVGDIIYYEENGKIRTRIAELKDKTMAGDTILIKKAGVVEGYKIQKD